MVDTNEFEILSRRGSEINTINQSNKGLRFILPFIIFILGFIFSGGRPEIILMSIFVSVLTYMALTNVNSNGDPFMRESHFRELQQLIYQMNQEIEELKNKKN